MKRKLVSLVLSMVILMSCLPFVGLSVAAQAQGTAVTVADAPSVAVGEELTFTVQVDSAGAQLNAFAVVLGEAFDDDVFAFVSAEWLIEGVLCDVDAEKLNAVIAFNEPTAVSGDVLSFTLKAKSDLAATTEVTVCASVQGEEEIAFTTSGFGDGAYRRRAVHRNQQGNYFHGVRDGGRYPQAGYFR